MHTDLILSSIIRNDCCSSLSWLLTDASLYLNPLHMVAVLQADLQQLFRKQNM